MLYVHPLNFLVILTSFQSFGIQGAISRPSHLALTPKIYCVAAMYIHAAVPVSHDTFARPNLSLSGPKMFEAYT